MRLKHTCLAIGLGVLALVPVAQAADWNTGAGGLKDHRGRHGVAIPAPIPVLETFKWYLRADVGGGLIGGGDTTVTGDIFGYDRTVAEGPFGMGSSWFSGGFDTFAVGGVGAGAYLTPRLRADVTIDARTRSSVDAHGTYQYNADPLLNGGQTIRVDGNSREQTQVRGTVALANLYWDLTDRGSRFVPYIGAGVGFVVRSLDRRHETFETLTDVTDPLNPVSGPTPTRTLTGQTKAHQVAPAAAVMAGFGYTLDQGMVLDFNYRYTYLGEVDTSTSIGFSTTIGASSGATSRLNVGDTHEHALRAGVRWNVW